MDMIRINSKLIKIYDELIKHENYQEVKGNNAKLSAIFLGQADKMFDVPYEMSGSNGVYSYYNNRIKFIEIDLNKSPRFENKEEFIEWFSNRVYEARSNLGK